MENKKDVRAIVEFNINVKWQGTWRMSPAYPTEEAATAALIPFMRKFTGKFLPVTIVRNVRYVAAQ
jgi:hypothetical protein